MNKICPRCQIDKPVGEFGRNATRPYGFKHICKECEKSNVVTQVHVSLEGVVKECGNCHRTLSSRAFSYQQYADDKLSDECRTCKSYKGTGNPTLEQVLEYEEQMREIFKSIKYDPDEHRILFERQVIYALEDTGLDQRWKLPVWINKKLHGLKGGKKQ